MTTSLHHVFLFSFQVVFDAAKKGDLDSRKQQVDWTQFKEGINVQDKRGWTCVYFAAYEGHLDVLKWLDGKDCDFMVQDNKGKTCVQAAGYSGHLNVLKWLDRKGCDLMVQDNRGDTCAHYAAQGGHLNVLKWLKEMGFDLMIQNNDGKTCVHYASLMGRTDILKWFEEKSCEVTFFKRIIQINFFVNFYQILKVFFKN